MQASLDTLAFCDILSDAVHNSDEFRTFLGDWLDHSGMSQNQLALEMGIGQGVVSRWLHPDPRRRTQPDPKTLEILAPVVRKPYGELMILAKHWSADPKAGNAPTTEAAPMDPPELSALQAQIAKGFYAMSDRAGERGILVDITRNIWHRPTRKPGRPRTQYPSSLANDERLDRPNDDSVVYHLVGIS